mmetsp:Transcript_29725/g.55594  ORF Transcript_29725/g.55594 Transcript_29725/m.55594 type:complete len:282 (-) Transcript_29725:834-1679(-)
MRRRPVVRDVVVMRSQCLLVLRWWGASDDTDVHLSNSVPPFRHSLDLVLHQADRHADNPANSIVDGLHRPPSRRRVDDGLPGRRGDRDSGRRVRGSTGDSAAVDNPLLRRGFDDFAIKNGLDVCVSYCFLLVSSGLESLEGCLDYILRQSVVTKLLEALLEGVFSRVLAQNQSGLESNAGRGHNFVRGSMLQNAILVDASLMCECIRPHNGLVWLDGHASNGSDHSAGSRDLRRVHQRLDRKDLWARVESHNDLLEGGVTGSFADAVDGYFHLARAAHDTL